MARTSNTKLLKSNDKTKASKETSARKSGKGADTVAIHAKVKAEAEVKAPTATAPSTGEKKVSQKLLETLEKRRKNQIEGRSAFGKPAGRRGRRPKSMAEYTPGNQEEEASYVLESDHESIEYDTGIRLKDHADDRGYNMDVEFDEELNFDW